MKALFTLIIFLTTISAGAQGLDPSVVKDFELGMNYHRATNEAAASISYQLMEKTLFEINKVEPANSRVLAALEAFSSRRNIYEKFFLIAVQSQSGNVEYSRMLLYGLCENMNVSIAIVDFIKSKYKTQLMKIVDREDSVKTAVEEEEAAKERIDDSIRRSRIYENYDLDSRIECKNLSLIDTSVDDQILDLYQKGKFDVDSMIFKIMDFSLDVTLRIDSLGNVIDYSISKDPYYPNVKPRLNNMVNLEFLKSLKFDKPLKDHLPVKASVSLEIYKSYVFCINIFGVEKDGSICKEQMSGDGDISKNTIYNSYGYYDPLFAELKKKGTYKVEYLEKLKKPSDRDFDERFWYILKIIKVEPVKRNWQKSILNFLEN